MPKEVDYQGDLVKAVKAEGGHAFKLSNRFLVGIPDLLLKHPAFPCCIAEVKVVSLPVRPESLVRIDLTAKQKINIRSHQRAGGYAGWIALAPLGAGKVLVYAHTDITHEPAKELFQQCAILKTPQTGWGPAVRHSLRVICGTGSPE